MAYYECSGAKKKISVYAQIAIRQNGDWSVGAIQVYVNNKPVLDPNSYRNQNFVFSASTIISNYTTSDVGYVSI